MGNTAAAGKAFISFGRVVPARLWVRGLGSVLLFSLLIGIAGCAAIPVRGARIESVDVEMARRVLEARGFKDVTVERRALSHEEMVELVRSMGLPVDENTDAHASITTVSGSIGEGELATVTLISTSKPCWPENDALRYDRFVGDFRWGKGTVEVGTWCYFHEAGDEVAKECGKGLMEDVLDAAGRER